MSKSHVPRQQRNEDKNVLYASIYLTNKANRLIYSGNDLHFKNVNGERHFSSFISHNLVSIRTEATH